MNAEDGAVIDRLKKWDPDTVCVFLPLLLGDFPSGSFDTATKSGLYI